MRYGYDRTGDPEVRAQLDGSAPSPRIKVICLNDVPPPAGEEDADPRWLAAWLDRRFPIRASFEIPS